MSDIVNQLPLDTPLQKTATASRTTTSTAHDDKEPHALSVSHQPDQEQLSLSNEAMAVVRELQQRDLEVKRHEKAHMAAGAGLTGGAHYTYQKGPDGQRYAIGGEVSIDTSEVQGDPARTIKHAESVRRAALAPANPSAQDLAVAAQATQTIQQAQVELADQSTLSIDLLA